jgi:hypothetical protein
MLDQKQQIEEGYQSHGKMKSEASSTQIYNNSLSWLVQELQ